MDEDVLDDIFPHDSYRKYQKEVLKESIIALNDEDKDVMMIEAPVGTGKSPVNISIAKYFGDGFYTTPQRKLVRQLQRDYCPTELAIDGGISDIMGILGRENYKCRESLQPSDKCKYRKQKIPCSERENCTYYKQKKACKQASVTVMTFSMLITDSFLRLKNPSASFNNRDLLIIDEAHNLEDDTATMFAGFKFSPETLPEEIWNKIYKQIPRSKDVEDHNNLINIVYDKCKDYQEQLSIEPDEKDMCRDMCMKIEYFWHEMKYDRMWVVNIEKNRTWNRLTNRNTHIPVYSPIKVDGFLSDKVWSRADKVVLSTARFPYRDHPRRWLDRIGLKGVDFKFKSVPMTFPKENRPIITKYMGGKMTNKGEKKHWDINVRTLDKIIDHHEEDRGVVHTQSYDRAKKLADDLENDVFVHVRTEKDVITSWLESDRNVLLSPSIKEGVDLKGDICRYQVLFKAPFPHIKDSRVNYLINELNDWEWYYDKTAEGIVQSYGRAIRSKDDEAKYYVLDSSFKDVIKRADIPEWFEEAMGQ